ncbi:ABC transporter permease subunit [Clostridiaceae bacterium 35-E11]
MWQKNKPYILIFPALVTIVGLFAGGFFEGFLQSIGLTSFMGVSRFSLYAYKKLLNTSEFWDAFLLTLRIALIATGISAAIGMLVVFCLFWMQSEKKGSKALLWQRFFQIPMLFPYLIAAYLIFLMCVQSGWISRIFFHLGLIKKMEDFPILVHDSFGWGIIIAYVWKTAPFMVLMLYPALMKVKFSWIELGYVFGANRLKFFVEVVFPLLAPVWKMTSFIVFSYTFLAFEIPFLLGVTYPKVLSVYAYQIYMNGDLIDRPMAMAVNVLIILCIAVLGGICYILDSKREKERGKWNG